MRNITRKTFVAVDNIKKKKDQKPLAIIFHGVERSLYTTIVPSLFYPFILIALNSVPLLFYFFAIDKAADGIGGHGRLCAQSVKNEFLKNAWGRCLVSAVITQLLETDRRSLV